MADEDPVFYVRAIPHGGGGASERIDVSHRVDSLVYEDEESKQDKLKLSVDNFDLTNFDAPVFKEGNKLEVSWGYPGRMSPPRTVTISKVTGGRTLSVEALDDGMNLNKVQKVRTWERMSRSQVAAAIAAEHGYPADRQHVDDTVEVLEQVTQARMTDGQLLQDMARREGFEYYVDFDGFHFHPRRLDGRPVKRLVYYVDNPGLGDIIDWNLTSDIYSAGKTGAVSVQARDLKTKTDVVAVGDNSKTKRVALAPVVSLSPGADTPAENRRVRFEKGRAVVVASTEATPASLKRQADGMFKKAQLAAIEVTLELRGDAELLAKSIVEVVGIGATISGNYYLTSVHHKVGSGYLLSCKARRDGKTDASAAAAGGASPAKPVAAKAKLNDQKAPTEVETELVPVVSFVHGRAVTRYERRPKKG